MGEDASAAGQDLKSAGQNIASAAHAGGEALQHQAANAAHAAEVGAEIVQDAWVALRRHVMKHPTSSLVTTLFAGVILGKLIGR